EYLTRDLPGTPQSDPGEEAGRPAQAGRAPEAVGEAMRGEDKGRCAGKAGGQGGKADLEPGGERLVPADDGEAHDQAAPIPAWGFLVAQFDNERVSRRNMR